MNNRDIITEDIIEKAQSGNDEAFTFIYENCYKRVYFMAMEFFHNEEIAQDIVQDTFVKVHQNLDKLNGPKAFNLWFKKIAYNTCLNAAKKKRIDVVDLNEDDSIERFEGSNKSIEDQINNDYLKEKLSECIETLSFPLQAVALLSFYDGLTIDEISMVLDIPKGTVNSRLNRVKIALKGELEKRDVTPELCISCLSKTSIISSAFILLANNYQMSESNHILSTILDGRKGIPLALLGLRIGAIVVASSAVVATVTVGVNLTNQSSQKEKDMGASEVINVNVGPAIIEPASINSISLSTPEGKWTNTGNQVIVDTSNNNFDKVLVNGSANTTINENGTYKVVLERDGKEISSQNVTVNNIDKEHPTATTTYTGDTFTIKLKDNLSGINYSNIEYKRDGVLSNDYTVDQTTNTIVVNSKYGIISTMRIYDNAGNYLDVKIK